MNAYALYPTRPKLPTWVGFALAGLGATFVLLTVAVAVVVVRSTPASAADLPIAASVQKAIVAPVAQPVVTPAPVADSAAPVAAVAPAAHVKHAVKRHVAAKRTYVASAAPARGSKARHGKKDDSLEKLLGL